MMTLSYQCHPSSVLSSSSMHHHHKPWKVLENCARISLILACLFNVQRNASIGFLIGPEWRSSPSTMRSSSLGQPRTKKKKLVSTVDELRQAVLKEGYDFAQLQLPNQRQQLEETEYKHNKPGDLLDHSVLQLIQERFQNSSLPGQRSQNDTAVLALAIEGGGMRGCVSAGMAAAIVSLGLVDTIDKIYGSSAGSVVGSYMISRQMCVDVYVDLLPAAQRKFVCLRRLASNLAKSALQIAASKVPLMDTSSAVLLDSIQITPGMNISFVLDGIMDGKTGLRPLDVDAFRRNDKLQPLRVVSSCIDPQTGEFLTKCFGTEEFFEEPTMARRTDGRRDGLFACLEASMTVPGAAGAPVPLAFGDDETKELCCFDAFCFEPIPYRSAVEEGATHVLTLCSRPLGFQPLTDPTLYESTVAPVYFRSHGYEEAATFLKMGGQQYLYAEDILTCQEAKRYQSDKIKIPPAKLLYGVNPTGSDTGANDLLDTSKWNTAHMLPVQVPASKQELGTLEQGRSAVLEAVRSGYSAAFDQLAPLVGGLEAISGDEAAELIFPDILLTEDSLESPEVDSDTKIDSRWLLDNKLQVPGEPIQGEAFGGEFYEDLIDRCFESKKLFDQLPGFQHGHFAHLSKGIRYGTQMYLAEETRRQF